MAVGPIHAVGPASRFRPRFARLIAEGEEVSVAVSQVDPVAAVGQPEITTDVVAYGRAPINFPRPVSRFRPRIARPPSEPAAASTGSVAASSVAGVSAVGNPQVITTGSGGYVASRSITRPISRFRPRIERWAHFAELTGQTIFQSSVESTASVGQPAVTEEFSLDGGGALPDGWGVAASSVASVAEIGYPAVSDVGAVILAGSVTSNTLFGAPFVFSGQQIRTSSVDSVAAVGSPEITVTETTIRTVSVSSGTAFGGPIVDDGIGSWLGPAGRSSSRTRGNRKFLVQFKGRHLYFESEREAQEFIQWRSQQEEAQQPKQRPKKRKPLRVVNLAPEPPKPPTPEELAAQAKQAEIDAIKARYEAQMADIKKQADAEIALLTATANLMKQDNEALRMLIEA